MVVLPKMPKLLSYTATGENFFFARRFRNGSPIRACRRDLPLQYAAATAASVLWLTAAAVTTKPNCSSRIEAADEVERPVSRVIIVTDPRG